jgi:hypothetical protein
MLEQLAEKNKKGGQGYQNEWATTCDVLIFSKSIGYTSNRCVYTQRK